MNQSISKYAKDTQSEAMFAISAISSVQELLGVRHAASGSAATNPGGTIKLHLNNVSRRIGARVEEWKKGERHRGEEGDPRVASLQKKVRSEW